MIAEVGIVFVVLSIIAIASVRFGTYIYDHWL
jgi:Na+-transporting methylmalonyl-CoA/oxaloacetate decarboxylase gamma subunit